jgi:prolyl oligopeptidase
MKKTITISAIVCTLFMNAQTKINYPETKKANKLTLILT